MTDRSTNLDLDERTPRSPAAGIARYLLFAGGDHPPRGGLGDLVATFTSEDEARAAFRAMRRQSPSPTSWAQLAGVEGDAGIRPLCWFGIGASPDHLPMARPSADGDRPRRVRKRTIVLLTGMVAIFTSTVAVVVKDSAGEGPGGRRTPAVAVTSPAVPFAPPDVAGSGDSSPDR